MQLVALNLPSKVRILSFELGDVAQPQRQPVLPRCWLLWLSNIAATHVAAYLMMGRWGIRYHAASTGCARPGLCGRPDHQVLTVWPSVQAWLQRWALD